MKKTLHYNRNTVTLYTTGVDKFFDFGKCVELYANTAFFDDGKAGYYFDMIGDDFSVDFLGTFDSLEEAKKKFFSIMEEIEKELDTDEEE